jgi:hypothetical protein
MKKAQAMLRQVVYVSAASAFLLLVFSFATPAVKQDDKPVFHPLNQTPLTYPLESVPVFTGIAARLQNREEELSVALSEAAVQVSRYLSLSGSFSLKTVTKGGFSASAIDVRIEDDEELAEQIVPELNTVNTFVTSSGTIVRCTYPGAPEVNIRGYYPRDADGNPNWVEKPPDISNHFVGIGISERQRLIADSVAKADKAALADVLSQISLSVQLKSDDARFSGVGTVKMTRGRQTARGTLAGFYVLDRWMSENGESFYSLAICPEKQPREEN